MYKISSSSSSSSNIYLADKCLNDCKYRSTNLINFYFLSEKSVEKQNLQTFFS